MAYSIKVIEDRADQPEPTSFRVFVNDMGPMILAVSPSNPYPLVFDDEIVINVDIDEDGVASFAPRNESTLVTPLVNPSDLKDRTIVAVATLNAEGDNYYELFEKLTKEADKLFGPRLQYEITIRVDQLFMKDPNGYDTDIVRDGYKGTATCKVYVSNNMVGKM